MPRKKLVYTHEFPYHVYARSNNREWFYLPPHETWNIFVSELNRTFTEHKMSLHAFVLMSNHYHMLVTADPSYSLGEAMCELQKSVSRRINKVAERSNHVFGGPYKAALIKHGKDFSDVLKYIYRNPVKAGMVDLVEKHPYSTISNSRMIITPPSPEIMKEIPCDILTWLNSPSDQEKEEKIKKALRRTEFKIPLRQY